MGCTVAVVKRTQPNCNESIRRFSVKRGILSNVHADTLIKLDLNEREIFQLQQSWKGISRRMEYTGINMFIRIFETHEEMKKFFFMIEKCHTISEIRESKGLAKHVLMVMHTLNETIYNLNNMSYVSELLHEIGKKHRKYSDYSREFFLTSVLFTKDGWLQTITEPFLLAVKETLGDRFTPHMETVYRKLILFIIDNLYQGFEESAADKTKPIAG